MDTFLNRNFKVKGNINCLSSYETTFITEQIENIDVHLVHKSKMKVTLLGNGLTNSEGEFNIEFEIDSPVDYIVDGKIGNVFIEAYYNGELLNPPTYDEDALLYFAQLDPGPSAYYMSVVNDLIKQLKADNNWQYLDRLWIFGAEKQQHTQVSLKNPSATKLNPVNSPIWDSNVGYTAVSNTAYLDTNFIPSVDGVNYSLNSAVYGCYQTANVAASNKVVMGQVSGTANNNLFPRFTGDLCIGRINQTTGFNSSANTDGRGLFSMLRSASNVAILYKNGVSQNSTTSASTSLGTTPFYIMAQNPIGTQAYTGVIAYAFFGGSNINQLTFYNAMQTFAIAMGFNV